MLWTCVGDNCICQLFVIFCCHSSNFPYSFVQRQKVDRQNSHKRIYSVNKRSDLGVNVTGDALTPKQSHHPELPSTSNVLHTLSGWKIVDHSDVTVGAATTSSFSIKYLASLDWAKQFQDETRNSLVLEFGASFIWSLTVCWILDKRCVFFHMDVNT